MASLMRSLNIQPQLDKYAQHLIEKQQQIDSELKGVAAATATTTIATTKISNLLQEFGASFINSIQLQNFQKTITNRSGAGVALSSSSSNLINNLTATTFDVLNQTTTNNNEMEIDYIPNHIIIDSSTFDSMDELQKQLEYDKFMNEVWIGIVLTLILISMIFCICSCFLYHQFRTWKRNYHSTVVRANSHDIESNKNEQICFDDPVPEYTLVSGLPSYEAALELMQKTPTTPKSCLIVYPSVFNVFNKNEKSTTAAVAAATTATNAGSTSIINQQHGVIDDSTTPLLITTINTPHIQTTQTPQTTTTNLITNKSNLSLPNYAEIMQQQQQQIQHQEQNSTKTFNIDFNNKNTQNQNKNEKELLELLNETNFDNNSNNNTNNSNYNDK